MIRGNCALPKIQIDTVINATIEYTDFLDDALQMNNSYNLNVDSD
jgi:hypothetical protein